MRKISCSLIESRALRDSANLDPHVIHPPHSATQAYLEVLRSVTSYLLRVTRVLVTYAYGSSCEGSARMNRTTGFLSQCSGIEDSDHVTHKLLYVKFFHPTALSLLLRGQITLRLSRGLPTGRVSYHLFLDSDRAWFLSRGIIIYMKFPSHDFFLFSRLQFLKTPPSMRRLL